MISEAIIGYGTVGAFHCKDIFDLKGNCKPEDVHTFECQVDTTESSISFIGDRFPNLRKLKLNNSIIPNMRDIGCRFTNLRFLSLARCGITSLNGISTISQVLEELYLAFNKIDDCSELVGMDSLIVIDLEENNISDLSNIEFLSTCSNLQSLTLSGNPCVDDPESYRTKVRDLLPKLRYLDERRLQPKEAKANPRSARIKNEINYRKVKAQPKEPENKSPKEPNTASKEPIQNNEQEKIQSKPKEDIQKKVSEPENSQQKEKVQQKSSEIQKNPIKEPPETKIQVKPKEKIQAKEQEKAQSQPKEKEQTKASEPETSHQKQKEKVQQISSGKEKNLSKESTTTTKVQTKQKVKHQTKEPEPEKAQTKQKVQNKPKESQTKSSNSGQKKVQIAEPSEKAPEQSKSFQVTEPPTPPPETFKVKEPQYENDDEVIITEMLDDMIEDRPPTARGNYESKFFKDSFELQQRYKTPIALKTKPHVIMPKVPRGRKPRAISSVKKLA